jgi:hypothetical protein
MAGPAAILLATVVPLDRVIADQRWTSLVLADCAYPPADPQAPGE